MSDKETRPTAYLIVGFIGSGKATYAKQLAEETGSLRLTKDEWIIRIFGSDPTIEGFEQYDECITELCLDLALECLKAGTDVIIDDGLWVRSQRDELRERISNIGAKAVFYYLKCSYETMKRRTLCRNEAPSADAFRIDESMFDSYWKFFDEPGCDEDCLLIENN